MKARKMQLKEFSLVFLTSSLFVVLTSQPSLGFSLTYSNLNSEAYNNKASSKFVGDIFGEEGATITSPLEMILVPQNNATPFLKKLQKDFGGWDFNFAKTDLSGSFDIQYYYACGNQTACGKGLSIPGTLGSSMITPSKEGVGTAIQLDYIPSGNDTPQSDMLHWIQWVVACEKVNIDGTCAVNEQSFIDIQPTNNSTPYYDTNSRGAGYYFDPTTKQGQNFFIDRVYRPDGKQIRHNWSAELYLAKAIGGKKVEILNGIKWGWKNTYTPPRNLKTFSGTLTSGFQTDTYKLDKLTPGSKYTAWTNNDLPSNRCNPNTALIASSSGNNIAYDDNSSPVGNGFASGLIGTVGSSGTINLGVGSATPGARGQDKGNYELFVNVYNPGESPTFSNGNSGGGGFGKEMRGLTQQNPILPTSVQNGWQTFNKVPGCRWYDPHTTYGFEFQSLEDTLFTEILDFPVGEDTEFAVTVGNVLLGTFGPGSSIDFVSLLGHPVNNFRITGINSLIGATAETAFPIQLAFNKPEGSFQMREFSEDDPEDVPEPATVLGTLLALGGLGRIKKFKNRK